MRGPATEQVLRERISPAWSSIEQHRLPSVKQRIGDVFVTEET